MLSEVRGPEELHWAPVLRLPGSIGPGTDGMEIRPPPAMLPTRRSQLAASRLLARAAETFDPEESQD